MKTIIFGANGQDGHYLAQLLKSDGVDVIGVSRKGSWTIGDVSDFGFVQQIIREQQPDYVFHLAANSTTAHGVWEENHHTICDGSLYVLESVKQFSPHTKVFISGSALQFQNDGSPIGETTPFAATSAYAVSRIHTTYAARYYRSLGVRAYVGYFFNHESPLRSERHVSMKVAAFVRRLRAGEKNARLEIGDPSVEKEWTFAGDTVRAVWMLVQQEEVFESVIGSGVTYSIADWLETCFSYVEADWKDYVTVAPSFKAESSRLVSDPSTLAALGWKPEVSLRGLAQMMIDQ